MKKNSRINSHGNIRVTLSPSIFSMVQDQAFIRGRSWKEEVKIHLKAWYLFGERLPIVPGDTIGKLRRYRSDTAKIEEGVSDGIYVGSDIRSAIVQAATARRPFDPRISKEAVAEIILSMEEGKTVLPSTLSSAVHLLDQAIEGGDVNAVCLALSDVRDKLLEHERVLFAGSNIANLKFSDLNDNAASKGNDLLHAAISSAGALAEHAAKWKAHLQRQAKMLSRQDGQNV